MATSSVQFFSATPATNIFTVISNLPLLLTSWVAWRREYIFISVLFFIETWISSLYHLCKGFEVCAMDYWTLRNFDFFFATSMVWLASVFLIWFTYAHRHWELVLNVFGLLTIAIIQFVLPGEHGGVAVFTGVALLLIFLYIGGFMIYRYQHGHYFLLPPYNFKWLALATALLVLSTILYTFQNYWLSAYWAIHALWHILAALGWVALLWSKPKRSEQWRLTKASSQRVVAFVPMLGVEKQRMD